MRIRGLVLFLVLLALSASGQQVQSAPPQTTPANASVGSLEPAPALASEKSNGEVSKLDLTPDANGKLSQEQMQALLRVVADKDLENDKRQRDYTYIERDVDNKLDGKGNIKSTEVRTYEILEIYGEQVRRLIEKDDKPLDAKEAAKQEEKIQKVMDKRKNESEEERKKRAEREEKEREDDRKFVRDVADAYNFTLVGTETVGGREAWVIDGEPRAGFVPTTKEGKYLSDFHGRVWIDKGDLQLTKLDVECLDTISWGLFLARFHKGSRFQLEQTRVNDEVWLQRHVAFKIDVRLALLKDFHVDIDQTFRDYKKFRTSARIVGVQEMKTDEK